jgi:hypothetical protein
MLWHTFRYRIENHDEARRVCCSANETAVLQGLCKRSKSSQTLCLFGSVSWSSRHVEWRFTHESAGDGNATGRPRGSWLVHLLRIPVRVSVDASNNRYEFARPPYTRFHVNCVLLVCFLTSVDRVPEINPCRPFAKACSTCLQLPPDLEDVISTRNSRKSHAAVTRDKFNDLTSQYYI